MPSCSDTGGTRDRSSWATSSASSITTRTCSRRSRPATTSRAIRRTRWRRRARPRGGSGATTNTGSTRPTPGSTATSIARPSAWSTWRTVIRRPTAAARELMLAQSSDWAFIMRTGSTVAYATRRMNEHILRFNRLFEELGRGQIDAAWLAEIEARDNIFPDLDYRLYAT